MTPNEPITNEAIAAMIERLDDAHNNPAFFALINEAAEMFTALLAEREWRPIAEAPEPEPWETVLLFERDSPLSHHREVFEGYYDPEVKIWRVSITGPAMRPTHWRPLPAPPDDKP